MANPDDDFKRRRRRRSLMIGLGLGALAVIFYAWSIQNLRTALDEAHKRQAEQQQTPQQGK